MTRPTLIFTMLKETVSDWVDDKAARLAAALAFYTLLSLAPLLIIAVSVAGLVFGEEAARGEVATQLQGLLGAQAAEAIQSVLANAKSPASGIVGTIVGVAVLLFGASGVFGELQGALNLIWEVESKPGRGLKGFIRDRFFSLTLVVGVGFLLLVSLVLSAGLSAMGGYMSSHLPGGEGVWQILNFVVSLAVMTGLFALIFKVVPDVEIEWRDVWIGALFTAGLFTLGKFLIGLYLGRSGVGSPFGAAGSVVVLVVWVYYSSQILFLGAEFTQVFARHRGSRMEPTKNAVAIATEAEKRNLSPNKLDGSLQS
ncbi:MAG: YihY/virulence factor BrkB family protein [Deltaproteobacteria bacterium]|nr:YihY/virulence factor BrkB family protein [Deltaproteobacteria bacterium]